MTDGPVQRDYQLVPDRDLNGAGLVYFANYPMFLDICERDVLASAASPLSHDLIDQRTVVHRRSAYLNNASSRDTLRIEIEPWLRATGAGLHLHVNARMFRQSDQRLMMVSTVRKIVPASAVADWPALAATFRALRRSLIRRLRFGRQAEPAVVFLDSSLGAQLVDVRVRRFDGHHAQRTG